MRCAGLSQREIFTTLTMTAALGVNDGEIGDVVRTALATPYVGGVSIQPQFGSGRSAPIDPGNRLTHTGVLARLGPQTEGLVSWCDLTALPCSHPHCYSVGYLIRDDAGQWRSPVALIGPERLRAHLGLVANRIADDELPPGAGRCCVGVVARVAVTARGDGTAVASAGPAHDTGHRRRACPRC